MAHGVDLRGSSAPGDGDAQGTESPKKAGRLQHLKMRVAVSFLSLHPGSWLTLLDPLQLAASHSLFQNPQTPAGTLPSITLFFLFFRWFRTLTLLLL